MGRNFVASFSENCRRGMKEQAVSWRWARQRNRQAAGKPQHNSTLDKLLRQFSNYRRENCAKNYKIIQSVISIPKINTINTRQIRQMILNNT